MRKIGQIFILLLFAGILAAGCISQNSDYTLRIIPPENLQFPLKGTWKILTPLKEEIVSKQSLTQKWLGKTLHLSDKYAILDKYFLSNPRYQVKKVEAEAYLFYHHQAFPEGFHFRNEEIEVFTLSDDNLFFCELLREEKDKLLLNLFNNCYLIRRTSNEVDEKVFSNLKTTAGNTAVFDNNGTAETTSDHTGVLLGLRAPNRHSSMEDCYRTLWLELKGQKLAPPLEINTLIFPRRSGFYQLQVVKNVEGKKREDFFIVENVLKNEKENTRELPLDPYSWEKKEGYVTRRINYVGNDYLSIEETVKQTLAGVDSINEEKKLQIITIDGLPGMKAVKISDLVGPDALTAMEDGEQKLYRQAGLVKTGPLDETNFGLVRKMGYWIFNGRVNYHQEEAHKKESLEKMDYHLTVIPPEHLVCHNKLDLPWTQVKNHVPSAVDVFTSPAKNLALVVTNNEILVYQMNQGNLEDTPLEKIPLKKDEEIIMAEWALGHYVENWTLTFQGFV